MNIQPISIFNAYQNRIKQNTNKNQTSIAFSGKEKHSPATDTFLKNGVKALAVASAIAMTPAITSCEKTFLEEDCDHPNHIDPPYTNDSTEVKPDTIIKGITYKTPELRMKRYKIKNGDTTNIGTVTFSEGIVRVPYNAHKPAEIQTVLKFIEALDLNSKTITEEYTATRAFDYNMIPAQITWLDEKTGAVNQIKYNGFDDEKYPVKMDLTTIDENNNYIEKTLQLTNAGTNKLIVDVYPRNGSYLETRYLYTLDGNTVTKFDLKDENTFKKSCEYTPSGRGTSIKAKDAEGQEYNLANFDVLTAISEEE